MTANDPGRLPRDLDRAALAAVERATRGRRGDGHRLPDAVRERLEPALGGDLGAVRVHRGPEADTLARALGADAVTAGADVYLRAGAPDPGTTSGLTLLAHECAHALQHGRRPARPARGRGPALLPPDHPDEREADAAAAAALRGGRHTANCDAAPGDAARPLDDGEPLVLRRHASWEHRLLGDQAPADLNTIALKLPDRKAVLEGIRDFLWMWHQDPGSVTAAMINQRYPYIRTLRLQTSGLLVTYGELNTLPDYFANPGSIDQQPASIMLPILQAVRQEGYNRVSRLLGAQGGSFTGSVGINSGWDFLDLLYETKAVDNLTWNIGPDHTNHYTAVVARNACHFAPYSWYRWEQFHLIARNYAVQAFANASNPSLQATYTQLAWRNNGYADHFLQDSFAAGHLVNKTLIMQWFLEWVKDKWYVPVADWSLVKNMTTALQPGLAARGLYDWSAPGTVRDPQTAEEQPTEQRRMDTCGVQAAGGASQLQAYGDYLAFLNSTIVQSSSGALHDYFNARSVWAASQQVPQGFQLWGDDTMLNGGAGVQIAGETAHQSQTAIQDILSTGATSISVDQIFASFPTSVRAASGQMLPLQQWNDGLRDLAFSIFPDLHYYVLRAMPRIQYVSIDLAQQWLPALLDDTDVAIPALADLGVRHDSRTAR